MKNLDPKTFKIRSNVSIEDRSNCVCIVVHKKSRIIMKDGLKLESYAKLIRKHIPKPIKIETAGPICSKTKAYLQTKDILADQKERAATNQK